MVFHPAEDCQPNPRLSASAFSKLFFVWLLPLFKLGSEKDLEYKDLYQPLPEDCAATLGRRLIAEWESEVQGHSLSIRKEVEDEEDWKKGEKEKVIHKPSLSKALFRIFWKEWAIAGCFLFAEECLAKVAQPIFFAYLLRYFSGEFTSVFLGYCFATGVILSVIYYTVSHHPAFFCIVHLNMKIRIACSSLLYSKTLKLSQSTLDTTVGQVVNLLSNDVSRFDLCLNFLHYLWIGPLQLFISVWILWGYFGPACLSGVCFLLLYTPLQSFMGHLFCKLRMKVATKTDKRVRIMNEILNGICVIKMYAWELPFSKIVAASREDEMNSIGKQMNLRALNLGLYYVSSKIVIFLTLVSYILSGNYLTAEKVFVTMALYQNVRLLMTIFFPWGISLLAETKVSIKRIENFLLLEEFIPRHQSPKRFSQTTSPIKLSGTAMTNLSETAENPRLIITDACAKWRNDSQEWTLNKINIDASKGMLIGIAGPVGSGKSSLLQAILNELPLSSGYVKVVGKIGYSSQESWIFDGTVRDNILFGNPYNPQWYQKVVDACALRSDFGTMTNGDKTFVGEKGLSLSGGQKARISLARAVYAKADIYLLDDPLSATDAEVGKHLFQNCICKLLREKVCILVTHQVQFLSLVDNILVINKGTIVARGSYSELMKQNVHFEQTMEDESCSAERHDEMRRRQSSVSSATSAVRCRKDSVKSMEMETEQLLEGQEEKSSGSIGINTYWTYLHSGSTLVILGFILLSNLVTQGIYSGSDFWLRHWIQTEDVLMKEATMTNNRSALLNFETMNGSTSTNFSDEERNMTENISWMSVRDEQIVVYTALISSLFIMTLIRTMGFFKISKNSSVALHHKLFNGVLRAPMLFFEMNPVGRILNRFTKDVSTLDELLPFTLFDTLEVGLQVIGVIITVSIINPIFLIPSFVVAFLFFWIRNFFQKTARTLKRLEGTARSPVYTHLSTTLTGLTTIRAFQVEGRFQNDFDDNLNLHTTVFYLFNASARLLGIVVDWISILYISSVTYGVLALELDGPTAGLAIASAMSLTSWFQWGVRQSAEAENQMVSVERVLQYANTEPEAPLESSNERRPEKDWPTNGEIEFRNICVKYGAEEDPFLKDITCSIHPKEKIGIVGRTGAGKTTLASVLFRLTEPCSGEIIIDGVNVMNIGLHDLRSKISVIPQDPILFVGSLRKNLDPLDEYPDADIWQVLKEVHLLEKTKELPSGLESEVSEGGSNFSVGQRQLICMGRAILRKNKILVMDEATANVDNETDNLIQKTIREKFQDCTVLTIAHRLHTVIDADRIMVLESGTMKEFDTPHNLLSNPQSAFTHFVNETGLENAEKLIKIANSKR